MPDLPDCDADCLAPTPDEATPDLLADLDLPNGVSPPVWPNNTNATVSRDLHFNFARNNVLFKRDDARSNYFH
jgi:hypothetical protein